MTSVVASLLVTLLITQFVTSQVTHTGTTEDLPEVFVGRCYDYDVTRYNDLLPRVDTPCEQIWASFRDAFAYKLPCGVRQDDYTPFLEEARQTLPKDKTMFWSGIYNLAHAFAENGRRFVTLEDTLIGYLANTLTWCGQITDPGINYTSCPHWTECSTEASESFWSGASLTFANEAVGNITLMVDGSNPNKPAYRRDSFFGKYELPGLNASYVTAVNVIVVHALGLAKIETCNYGTLLMLKTDVEAAGFQFTCDDDPDSVMHLLCADDPESRECQLAQAHVAGDLVYRDDAGTFNQMPDMMA